MQRIGRYEVLSHLASGGMGQVYLARATGLGGFERHVVVKTLDPAHDDDGDDAFVTMFLDEARLVATLHHQYIAPIYEVGRDEEGRYFIVMDYVHGETAEAVLRRHGERRSRIPLAAALTVVSAIASALDYAHALCGPDGSPLDIVHRDVSLSNVMVGYDGAVKLIDFGIAKGAMRTTKTVAGTLKGKIGYLAPEQALARPVDHRADIFALGIVLYELTTMRRAFREASDLRTLEKITTGAVTPPSQRVSGYPLELERIVMKALAVAPDQRYQDAGAMGRELEQLAAQLGLQLGHAAIVDVMAMFDRPGPGGRRRLARSSSDVHSDHPLAAVTAGKLTIPGPDDDEKTPITDAEETTDPRPFDVAFAAPDRITAPLAAAEPEPELELVVIAAPAPVRGRDPSIEPAAPLVVRIATPRPGAVPPLRPMFRQPGATARAGVPQGRPYNPWAIAAAILGAAFVIAFVLRAC